MANKDYKTPLVSVVIITYNSAKYVLETLESAKDQTYQHIELIISDDCSTDDTVEICNTWLLKNKERFSTTKVIIVKENKGISANCNRGILHATADWIKFMAGDDILLPNCIEDNMQFVAKHPDVKVLFSQIYKFSGMFDLSKNHQKYPVNLPLNLMDPSFTANDQYKRLLLSDRITYTPSYFFNKAAIGSVGGYDEKLRLLEDYPMWLKLTKAGIQLYFMEKVTVAYRQHEEALNNMLNFGLFKPQYTSLEKIRNLYIYPNLPWDLVGQMKFKYYINKLFDKMALNKNTGFYIKLYQLFTVYLNPFQYVLAFKKHILKRGNTNIFYAG